MNVVFILVDALRADHLGCYGYGRKTSPNIDALAAGSTVFETAIAHASFTYPSMKSIFTSTYSACDNLGAILNEVQFDYKTMAECFKEQGYATAAVIGNLVLTREFIKECISKDATGFDKGFDVYDDALQEREPTERGEMTRSAESIAKSAIQLIRRNAGGNFFLFLHFMDCHAPYVPPKRFHEMFLKDKHFDGSARIEISGINFGNGKIPNYAALGKETRVGYYVAAYDGAIRYVDACVGNILGELKRLGIDGNTMVILMSDHGEAMGEHNIYFTHGLGLYEGTIRVPLIIYHPEFKAKRVKPIVRLVDLMPTILDVNGIAVPQQARGKSVLPLIDGSAERICNEAFSAINAVQGFKRFETMLYSVREQRWKLIQRESIKKGSFWKELAGKVPAVWRKIREFGFSRAIRETGKQAKWMFATEGQPGIELYDLENDPDELSNLAESELEETERLHAKLEKWKQEISFKNKGEQLEEVPDKSKEVIRRRLKSLGYI